MHTVRTVTKQLDVFRNSPAATARAYRECAETARRDPHWTPEQGEARARYYEQQAEKLEVGQ